MKNRDWQIIEVDVELSPEETKRRMEMFDDCICRILLNKFYREQGLKQYEISNDR